MNDNLDIANGFNKFFVSIGPKLANHLKRDIDPLSYVNNNINSIVVQEVSCSQVREVINSLNNSSPGHDEFPPFGTKACIDEFIKPITHMVNESLKSGVFPTELKLARVVPIFKSGDPSLLSNYRPISMLSLFSKFFEKIVYNLVFDFLSDNEYCMQGRPQDLGGGGGQEFFFLDLGICMLRSIARGFGGMPPPRKFLKRCNLVRFRVYFHQILFLFFISKITFLYKKKLF